MKKPYVAPECDAFVLTKGVRLLETFSSKNDVGSYLEGGDLGESEDLDINEW